MRKVLLVVISLALLMLPGAAFATTELVTNGGFETGDFTGWTQSGDTTYDGVSTTLPYSGTYSAYFGSQDDINGGWITQYLATVPGETYNLTFWLANDGTDYDNAYVVFWDGFPVIGGEELPSFPYSERSDLVVASSTSTPLDFGFYNYNSYFYLDDVSVTSAAVPEPTTLLLLGLGITGLAVIRRKI